MKNGGVSFGDVDRIPRTKKSGPDRSFTIFLQEMVNDRSGPDFSRALVACDRPVRQRPRRNRAALYGLIKLDVVSHQRQPHGLVQIDKRLIKGHQ